MIEHKVPVADTPMSERRPKHKKLTCDQVSTLLHILDRLREFSWDYSRNTIRAKSAKMAALLEVMELLDYEFEDNAAAGNALSEFWEFNEMRRDVRDL